jgi:hypothetical protein
MTRDLKTENRIAQLSRASDWRAALLIVTSDYFAHDPRVWQHVDLDRGLIRFEKMLKDGTFSSGEKNLLRIAASLFSTKEEINLWRTLGYLDENATAIALAAIRAYCEGSRAEKEV